MKSMVWATSCIAAFSVISRISRPQASLPAAASSVASHWASPIESGDMLTESLSVGSAASAFSAWPSASRSMARPSSPASTAGMKAPAGSTWPSGIRIRASISKNAGKRGSRACTTGW